MKKEVIIYSNLDVEEVVNKYIREDATQEEIEKVIKEITKEIEKYNWENREYYQYDTDMSLDENIWETAEKYTDNNIDEYSKESLEEYKKRPRKDIFYETYRLYEELYHNSYSKLTRSVTDIIEEYQ